MATLLFGGGVYNKGALTLTHSTISGNTAQATTSGGVFSDSGTLTLTHSTVSGNGAHFSGGGVFNRDGILTLTNSTVSDNETIRDSGGGGVFNHGTATLTNSTVSGNTAVYGISGVFNIGTLTLARTLISGNTATQGPGPEVFNGSNGTVINKEFNLFGHDGNAGVSGFSPGPTDIVPEVPLNQILAPLANNGGPTLTHALVPGSPAVDAVGDDCPPPSTDQRGVSRPQPAGGLCDIGFFDLQQAPPISIDSIIGFFDQAVREGRLRGAGPGKSGRHRLKALRNMLLAAGDSDRAGKDQAGVRPARLRAQAH